MIGSQFRKGWRHTALLISPKKNYFGLGDLQKIASLTLASNNTQGAHQALDPHTISPAVASRQLLNMHWSTWQPQGRHGWHFLLWQGRPHKISWGGFCCGHLFKEGNAAFCLDFKTLVPSAFLQERSKQ